MTDHDKPLFLALLEGKSMSEGHLAKSVQKQLKGQLKGKARFALKALVEEKKLKCVKEDGETFPIYYGAFEAPTPAVETPKKGNK